MMTLSPGFTTESMILRRVNGANLAIRPVRRDGAVPAATGQGPQLEDWRLRGACVCPLPRAEDPSRFRADVGFTKRQIYAFLEAQDIRYTTRVPANQVLRKRNGHLLTRPVRRPPRSRS